VVRVPLLMWWPGHVEGGWRYDGIVELIDLFPTLCDAARASTPSDLPGRSLLDDLRQRNGAGKVAAFSELYPMIGNRREYNADRPTRMVATQEWKLVQYGEDYANLFDLMNDPQEIHDLSNDPTHAGMLRGLRNMLHERMGEVPPPEERLVNGFYEHQTGWYNRYAQPSPHHSRIPRLREEERL
jgi:arylsulfatase